MKTPAEKWAESVEFEDSMMLEESKNKQPESILDIAKKITHGDRQATYGPPDQDFKRTAGMMNALFADLLKDGAKFEPQHIAMMMILVKLSRQRHQKKQDNWVDIAGYSNCGDVCDQCSSQENSRKVGNLQPCGMSNEQLKEAID